ncbi:MAG: (Fe-S)-binding protein [Candidatus Thorarchaeota archaeon]
MSRFGTLLLQCISCGDCREATDYTADPQKWGVCVAKDHTSGFEPYFGRGKMQVIRSLWQGKLELSKDLAEVIYQCPTCNACAEACAYEMDNALMFEALRAELVDAGYGLEAHIPMNKAIIELLNPYERDNKQKNEWTKKLNFRIKDLYSEEAEVLYFVGCTTALTPEIQAVAINTAEILKKLNIDYGIYGQHEICCGSVALRTGNTEAFNKVSRKNYELFRKSGIKTLITSCAGCFRTLRVDYGEVLKDLNIEILHSIEFIKNYIEKSEIRMKHLDINSTYHDPCHTGRNCGNNPLYEEPRELIRKIGKLTEMKTIKEQAKCCGAGGGVKKGFPDLAINIAKSRIKEAEQTGAEHIISICPFCYRNLSDAITALNSNIQMMDLTELVNKSLD